MLLLTGAAVFYLWSLYGNPAVYAIAPAWLAAMTLFMFLNRLGKRPLTRSR